MRVVACADVHLGNHRRHGGAVETSLNRRCRSALAVFRRAVQRAVELECDAFLIAGDLFDTARPEPQLVDAVQRIIEPYVGEDSFGLDAYALVGNHDQTSTTPGDHALGPLHAYLTVVDQPRCYAVNCRVGGLPGLLYLVPFAPGDARELVPASLGALVAEVPGTPERVRLAAIHAGLIDEQTVPWLREARDALPAEALMATCRDYHIAAAFAGNWHDRREWRGDGQPGSLPRLVQCGALVPTGWDNPGLDGYGSLVVWDDGRVRIEELPGPRFVAHKGDARELLELVGRAHAAGHELYVTWTVEPRLLGDAAAELERLVGAGSIAAGEALADDAIVSAEARTAAHAARSTDTLDEALDAYIRAMPLAEGVDRADVLARAKGYLAAGGSP